MCASKSRAAGATIQPRGLLQTKQSYVHFFVEVQNGRVRPGHTWSEPGRSTNSSISDSVQLEPGCDKSASEVATLPPG